MGCQATLASRSLQVTSRICGGLGTSGVYLYLCLSTLLPWVWNWWYGRQKLGIKRKIKMGFTQRQKTWELLPEWVHTIITLDNKCSRGCNFIQLSGGNTGVHARVQFGGLGDAQGVVWLLHKPRLLFKVNKLLVGEPLNAQLQVTVCYCIAPVNIVYYVSNNI